MNIAILLAGSFATWRLSHALVKEDGPVMVFARLRAYLASTQRRSGGFFDMFSCVYCISFWVALLAAMWVARDIFHWVGYALAFSGIAMFLEIFFMKQFNTLKVVTPPTGDYKVPVRVRPSSEQRNNVVRHPPSLNRYVTVETKPSLND